MKLVSKIIFQFSHNLFTLMIRSLFSWRKLKACTLRADILIWYLGLMLFLASSNSCVNVCLPVFSTYYTNTNTGHNGQLLTLRTLLTNGPLCICVINEHRDNLDFVFFQLLCPTREVSMYVSGLSRQVALRLLCVWALTFHVVSSFIVFLFSICIIFC